MLSDKISVLPQTLRYLPSTYVGVWKGLGIQNNDGEWTMLISLSNANTNSIVGTSSYPSLQCGGELTLLRVNVNSVDKLRRI